MFSYWLSSIISTFIYERLLIRPGEIPSQERKLPCHVISNLNLVTGIKRFSYRAVNVKSLLDVGDNEIVVVVLCSCSHAGWKLRRSTQQA
jgi:hypothetical protein